jgi:quercetin dioxygenase-like cupin family protein
MMARPAVGAGSRLSLEGADLMMLTRIRRWSTVGALALAMALVPLSSPASLAAPVEQAQARPTTSFEAWFEVEQPPTVPFEAVQLVVDFPVGSGVARHFHGGPAYITMLEGEMRMSIGNGAFETYGAGSSFVEPYEVVAEGANPSTAPASLLVTYLLPVGAAVTTLEQSAALAGPLPPGAAPRFESRMRIDQAPARYKVGQMLRTYAPGAWTVSEMAPAPRLLTVVSGEVTVLTGAIEQRYTAGQTWIESPGQAWLSGNTASESAVVAVSTTVPME